MPKPTTRKPSIKARPMNVIQSVLGAETGNPPILPAKKGSKPRVEKPAARKRKQK
ncbi:MAG: hypothetical protein ABMA13_24070 [Chthoniobacteraceae bacterium]